MSSKNQIIHALEKIVAGEETGCILTFLEPWLTISVKKTHDEYAFQFRYVYDTADDVWKEIIISYYTMPYPTNIQPDRFRSKKLFR